MDCSLLGSSVHEIFQARVLGGVPVPSPKLRLAVHNSSTNTRGLIPGSGGSSEEGNGNPLHPVFWPVESHGQRSLVGCSPQGLKKSDMTDHVVGVHSLSCIRLFATPWTAARQASLSITNSRSLLKLMSIELVMPSNHLILCCPLLLLPSVFPSVRVFSSESALHIRWPKYWSFSISPSNEYSGLISFWTDVNIHTHNRAFTCRAIVRIKYR